MKNNLEHPERGFDCIRAFGNANIANTDELHALRVSLEALSNSQPVHNRATVWLDLPSDESLRRIQERARASETSLTVPHQRCDVSVRDWLMDSHVCVYSHGHAS